MCLFAAVAIRYPKETSVTLGETPQSEFEGRGDPGAQNQFQELEQLSDQGIPPQEIGLQGVFSADHV